MTIKPSECPLDKVNKAARIPDKDKKHTHDESPCLCLDQHLWGSAMMDGQKCARCNQTRCDAILQVKKKGVVVGRARCDRAVGHASRHVPNIYTDSDRKRFRGH